MQPGFQHSSSWTRSGEETDSAGVPADEGLQTPATLMTESLPDTLTLALKEKPATFALMFAKALQKRVKTAYGPENSCIERTEDEHTPQKSVAGSAGVCGCFFYSHV
jgi:hypothetical protein